MASLPPQDELTRTILAAAQSMTTPQKADFLLQTASNMIAAGKYGEEVEHYLQVFLATPGLDTDQISKALMIRGSARRAAADDLLARAYQDFRAVVKLDPTNREVLAQIQRENNISPLSTRPSYCRAPEIWEMIASHIPRFHLRTWLHVSAFHRAIARRVIFRTIDIYFGEDSDNNLNRGLDIFNHVKQDASFAKLVRTLRIHWSYEEGDLLDLMKRMFREALPAFKALQEFEWIGYPEMRQDMIQAVLAAHPHLRGLGLIGWHFDAVGVSGFRNLRRFTLRAEDDDGFADMGEVRSVLDHNQDGLVHLTLGAYLERNHCWDLAFHSVTIQKLTHLDLVDTRISHFVLTRIAHAQNLQSLTLHGTFERPDAAGVVFGSDHVIDGQHTFLPHLESFRFVMVGSDDKGSLFQNVASFLSLFRNVVSFLRNRTRLRRLDLGDCPWDLVKNLLPGLTGLRVLRVRMPKLNDQVAQTLVEAVPSSMVALHLSVTTSDRPINTYAGHFARFYALSMLHLASSSVRRPQPNLAAEKDFQVQYETWTAQAKCVAVVLPTLDFVGWHGEHYVVVRNGEEDADEGENAEEEKETGKEETGKETGKEKETEKEKGKGKARRCKVELKELPARRRLDCGKGVDLGGVDACWLERKDVPIDYERSGLES